MNPKLAKTLLANGRMHVWRFGADRKHRRIIYYKGHWHYFSRVLWSAYNNKEILKGQLIHHVDGNQLNDHPDNLQLLPNHAEHKLLHAQLNFVSKTMSFYDDLLMNNHDYFGTATEELLFRYGGYYTEYSEKRSHLVSHKELA